MSYLDTIGVCDCNRPDDAVEERGYLGWYSNLSAVLRRYPQPRIGWSFNNVETRSVWIYDGARWCNTTQGNPFTLITELTPICGTVREGYAETFYYIPTEEGTVRFVFSNISGLTPSAETIEVEIMSVSDIVFIEWTGSELHAAVHVLDADIVRHAEGKLYDVHGEKIELVELEEERSEREENDELLSNIIDEVNKNLNNEIDRAKKIEGEIQQSVADIETVMETDVVKKFADDLLMSGGTQFYPKTTSDKVIYDNITVEAIINTIISRCERLEGDLNSFLLDADLTEDAKDTLREIQQYINSDMEEAATMMSNIAKLREEKVDIKGGDITHTVVDLGDGEKQQLSDILISAGQGMLMIAEELGTTAAKVDRESELRQEGDEKLASKINKYIDLVLTTGGEVDGEVDGDVINEGLRLWMSGEPQENMRLRLMRNLSRRRGLRRSGWRPVVAASRKDIHKFESPLDYVVFPLPHDVDGAIVKENGLLTSQDGEMITARHIAEQFIHTVSTYKRQVRSGYRSCRVFGGNETRVDIMNFGLALYRYDDNGLPIERVSNIAPFGITVIGMVDQSNDTFVADYYFNMSSNGNRINPRYLMSFPKVK